MKTILLYNIKPEIIPPGWEHETLCTRRPKEALQSIQEAWLNEANERDNPEASKIARRFRVAITVEEMTLTEWYEWRKINAEYPAKKKKSYDNPLDQRRSSHQRNPRARSWPVHSRAAEASAQREGG